MAGPPGKIEPTTTGHRSVADVSLSRKLSLMPLLFRVRQRYIESGAVIEGALCTHSSALAVDNALDGGEPDTSAFERFLGMKALENTEQLVFMLHIKSDSIILHKHDHLVGPMV